MFTHSLNPVLLSLGPLEIRWYGLFYALGFVITYFFVKSFAKKRGLPLKENDLDTLLVSLVIGVILGARLFEIIFYQPSYFFSHPLEMFAIWNGGLSFHGGLVGAFIAVWLFCKKRSLPFFKLADLLVIPTALALAFGRLGNFINGELPGRLSSLPWATKFPNVEGFRHPSQLYEVAKNLLIFTVLWSLRNTKKDGYLFGLFLIMYGSLRFLVEFVREPEVMLSFLTMGQWLSIPLVIIGYVIIKK